MLLLRFFAITTRRSRTVLTTPSPRPHRARPPVRNPGQNATDRAARASAKRLRDELERLPVEAPNHGDDRENEEPDDFGRASTREGDC